jgi:hypothetical protein
MACSTCSSSGTSEPPLTLSGNHGLVWGAGPLLRPSAKLSAADEKGKEKQEQVMRQEPEASRLFFLADTVPEGEAVSKLRSVLAVTVSLLPERRRATTARTSRSVCCAMELDRALLDWVGFTSLPGSMLFLGLYPV